MFQFLNKIFDAAKDGFDANQEKGKGIDIILNPILKFVKSGIKAIWNGIKAISNTAVYGYKRYVQDKPASDQALAAASSQGAEAAVELGEALTATSELVASLTGVTSRLGYDKVLCPTAVALKDHVAVPVTNAVNDHLITPVYQTVVQKPLRMAASAANSLRNQFPIIGLRSGA